MGRSTLDWDDFRYFLTLADTGSVRNAAAALKVNPSTVTRRLEALEQHLGVLLFKRSPKGLKITPEGAEVIHAVSHISAQLAEVETALKGKNQRLEGRIRVALPDVLAQLLLADLKGFTEDYPYIDLEFVPSDQNLDLSQGELDVAIRATEHPPENMVGRPLGHVALAAYGGVEYMLAHDPQDLQQNAVWIDWVATGEVPGLYAQQREAHFPGIRVHVRCDQIFMQHSCIRANMGLGILPCYLAEPDDQLVRLPQMPVFLSPTLWLLSHPDLRGTRRMHTFIEFVRTAFQEREHQLKGAFL